MQQEEVKLTNWEEQQAKNAHHRALIMRILKDFPKRSLVDSGGAFIRVGKVFCIVHGNVEIDEEFHGVIVAK